MKFKHKSKCAGCGTMCNSFFGRNLDLCRRCFDKRDTNKIPMGARVFDEEVTKSTTVSFNITKTQKGLISKKLDLLYPDRKKKHYELSKMSLYVRGLVIKDIEVDSQSD